MRFPIRWKIDVPFHEGEAELNRMLIFHWMQKLCNIAQINTILHLCCTTPQMLIKMNRIDKNLTPWMSLNSFFFFLLAIWLNIASACQRVFHSQNNFKFHIIHSPDSLWHPCCAMVHLWWYVCDGTIRCIFLFHMLVYNKLIRCCTIISSHLGNTLSVKRDLSLLQSDVHWDLPHQN